MCGQPKIRMMVKKEGQFFTPKFPGDHNEVDKIFVSHKYRFIFDSFDTHVKTFAMLLFEILVHLRNLAHHVQRINDPILCDRFIEMMTW